MIPSRRKALDRFNARVHNFCCVHYPRIPAEKIDHGEFAFEQRKCHSNAVAAVRAGRADHVHMVWAGNEDSGCIHFINSKAGRYFDETWHQHDTKFYYRIIRRVHPDEYGDIGEILNNCKKMFADLLGCRRVRRMARRGDDIGV